MSGAHDLQAAVVAALKGDASLTALLGEGAILDRMPIERTFPLVVLGRCSVEDWGTDSGAGGEHLMTIACWSRETGRGQVLAIADRVTAVVEALSGTSGETNIVLARRMTLDHAREADDRAYRATLRFRVLTEPAEPILS